MTTEALTLATCMVKWLYAVTSAVLKALRALLEGLLILVDAQILKVEALIAQYEPSRYAEEYTWGIYKALIDKLKTGMMAGFKELGPGAEICPQFYHYITDPQLALLESSLDAFSIYKDRYFSNVYYLNELNINTEHWELIKAQLSATLDVLDDALYYRLIVEGVDNT